MPGTGRGNVPFWPAAGCHAQAGRPDRVAGTSTTVRPGNSDNSERTVVLRPEPGHPAVPSAALRVEWGGRTAMRTARREPQPRVSRALAAAVRVRWTTVPACLGQLRCGACHTSHVCPFARERDRGGAPDAMSRAGDYRYPAFEMSGHDAPLLVVTEIRFRGMPGRPPGFHVALAPGQARVLPLRRDPWLGEIAAGARRRASRIPASGIPARYQTIRTWPGSGSFLNVMYVPGRPASGCPGAISGQARPTSATLRPVLPPSAR
jgi:hypothetical protein